MAGTGCRTHRHYTAGCRPCQQITSRYDRRRRKMIADGTWLPAVPAEKVRGHVAFLRAEGMSIAAIARTAAVAYGTVFACTDQRRRTVHGPTAAAILAVTPRCELPAGIVPACGTGRRIRALVAIGYSLTDIAGRLGRHLQQVWEWAWERQPTVMAENAQAVADLFEQLSATPGDSVRARNDAARRGWPPPLAWDDIDDPNERPVVTAVDDPVVDWVAVEFALKGQPVKLTRLERHHAVHAGRERDWAYTRIAEALRMSVSRAKELGAKPLPTDCEVAA